MVIDLKGDETKDEVDVSKYPPPAGKQFTEPTLLFAVRLNHIVIIQSKSLRVQDLETHINWLLEKAGVMDIKQRVDLTDVIPSDMRKKLEKAPIKSLSIGVPLVSEPAPGAATQAKIATAINVAKGIGLDVLKSILSDKEYSALKVQDLTEIPDIQVNLQIKVIGNRKENEVNDKVMKKIMRELRHVDDPSFLKIDVKGMGRMNGSDLRVQGVKSIDSYDGVLDVADAYEVMRVWLESIVDGGTIGID